MSRSRSKVPGVPGPAGSLVIPADARISGHPPGVKGPKRSPKQLAMLRTAGYRQRGRGLDAKFALQMKDERAPERVKAYIEANEGDFAGLNIVNMEKLAQHSLMHDKALAAVERDGILVKETAYDSEGREISTRTKVNPAAELVLKLGENLGISADQQNLTPKARGLSKRDDAVAAYLNRQNTLRASLS